MGGEPANFIGYSDINNIKVGINNGLWIQQSCGDWVQISLLDWTELRVVFDGVHTTYDLNNMHWQQDLSAYLYKVFY